MTYYEARKKSFNRKYARAFSSYLTNPSRSASARFCYYADSHLSRFGKRGRIS